MDCRRPPPRDCRHALQVSSTSVGAVSPPAPAPAEGLATHTETRELCTWTGDGIRRGPCPSEHEMTVTCCWQDRPKAPPLPRAPHASINSPDPPAPSPSALLPPSLIWLGSRLWNRREGTELRTGTKAPPVALARWLPLRRGLHLELAHLPVQSRVS